MEICLFDREESMKLFDISDWCKNGLTLTDYSLLGETDAQPIDIGEVIKIGVNYYTVGILDSKNGYAGVHKVQYSPNPEGRMFEDSLVCPYCGYEDSDAFELSDDDGTVECGRCGAEIHYTRNIEVTYSTDPVKPPKVLKGKWKL